MSEPNIHRFTQAVIPLFENCEFCGEKILSILNSAYQCSQCLKFCHKQCCETADSIFPCSGRSNSRGNQELFFAAFPVNRSLAENTTQFFEDFLKPSMFKKDEKPAAMQVMRSFRNRANPGVDDMDSDSDSADHLTLSPSVITPVSSIGYNSSYHNPMRDSTVIANDISIAKQLYTIDSGIISKGGVLTIIVQQASDIPISSVKNTKSSVYCKVSLLPWAKERYHTTQAAFNDGFPDWEGHNNTFSFEYPGALPKVNPLISISIKTERTLFSLKRVTIGVAQVPLRKLEISANQYNDNWYPIYQDGKKAGAKIRVSFMLCQKEEEKGSSNKTNPQKTHYFEKQILDPTAFSSDCPVCRKSLISGLGGIVDSIYRCKVCDMATHGNCRERAKLMFKCVALNEKEKEKTGNEGDLSEKLLRTIRRGGSPIYNQPIGSL